MATFTAAQVGLSYPKGRDLICKIMKINRADSSTAKMTIPKDAVILSEEAEAYAREFVKYLNGNRLMAVVSKIGRVTDRDFSGVMSELMKDASIDFNKDFPELAKSLDIISDKEKKIVRKRIGTVASYVIRANFMNILCQNG